MKFLNEISLLQVADDATSEDVLLLVDNLVKKRSLSNVFLKSVTVNLPGIFNPLAATASPGSETLTFSLKSQTRYHVFAAPLVANGTPSFRALTMADISDYDIADVNYWTKTGNDLSYTGGSVSIGTAIPDAMFHVAGSGLLNSLVIGDSYAVPALFGMSNVGFSVNQGVSFFNTKTAFNSTVAIGSFSDNGFGKLQVSGSIWQSSVMGNRLLMADSNGTIVEATASAVTSFLNGAFVQNQASAAQSAAFWISGYGRIGYNSLTNGSTPRMAVTGGHTDTTMTLFSNNGNTNNSLDFWASEPQLTYDGVGIGSNVNLSPHYGRRNSSIGQSYIRFKDGAIYFAASSTETLNPSNSKMILNNAGRLGVGIMAPLTDIHIANIGSPTLRIQDLDGANQYGDMGHNGGQTSFVSRNGAANGSFKWYGYDGTSFIERATLMSSGQFVVGQFMSGTYPIQLVVSESTDATSKRAVIALGGWQLVSDIMADGTRGFGIYGNGIWGLSISRTSGRLTVGGTNDFGYAALQVNGSIHQTGVSGNKLLMADGNGVLVEATDSAVTGLVDGNFIQNQQASAQAANYWISGTGQAAWFRARSNYGYFGLYNSASEVQGIWGITPNYTISIANNDFGTQYGLVYAHTNAGSATLTGGTKLPNPGWGHQYIFTEAGQVRHVFSGTGYAWHFQGLWLGDRSSANIISLNPTSVSYINNNLTLGKSGLAGLLGFVRPTSGDSAGSIGFIDNNEVQVSSFGGAGAISFRTSSTTKMWLNTSGYLGINTNTITNSLGSFVVQAQGSILTNSISDTYGQFRMTNGASGAGIIHRNDGNTYYVLLTDSGSPYGTYNSIRPFYINLTDGTLNSHIGALRVKATGKVELGNLANAALLKTVTNGEITAATAGDVATLLGSGHFIQNQSASAQSANFWISGFMKSEGNVLVDNSGVASDSSLISFTAGRATFGYNGTNTAAQIYAGSGKYIDFNLNGTIVGRFTTNARLVINPTGYAGELGSYTLQIFESASGAAYFRGNVVINPNSATGLILGRTGGVANIKGSTAYGDGHIIIDAADSTKFVGLGYYTANDVVLSYNASSKTIVGASSNADSSKFIVIGNSYFAGTLKTTSLASTVVYANGSGILTTANQSHIEATLGYTPVRTTRTITINGNMQDLSSDVSFTISTSSNLWSVSGANIYRNSKVSINNTGVINSGDSNIVGAALQVNGGIVAYNSASGNDALLINQFGVQIKTSASAYGAGFLLNKTTNTLEIRNAGYHVSINEGSGTGGASFRMNTGIIFMGEDSQKGLIGTGGYKVVIAALATDDNALYVRGAIHTTDTMSFGSDRKLKDQIKPIQNALESLKQIGGYRYLFRGKKIAYGFIAQDVERYYPEMVSEGPGYKVLDYNGMIAVTAKAVVELSRKVDSNTQGIKELKAENSKQKKVIAELRAIIEKYGLNA